MEGGAEEKKEEEDEEEGGDDKGDGSVGEMKSGDYMIHVYIEKCKDMLVADGETVKPIVQVECLGQKQYSTDKPASTAITVINWSEHLFCEPRNVDKKEAEDAKIKIKLLDKGFFKDDLIGEFEFDMSYIYFMKEHVMLHKWLALANPNSKDFAKI